MKNLSFPAATLVLAALLQPSPRTSPAPAVVPVAVELLTFAGCSGCPAADGLGLTETGLSSTVGRGEKAPRLLQHPAIVRTLRPLGRVVPNVTSPINTLLTPDAQWQTSQLRVVVLVQQVGSIPLRPWRCHCCLS